MVQYSYKFGTDIHHLSREKLFHYKGTVMTKASFRYYCNL